ncbi:MAG: PepSY domain-containing protein [Cyclobacteriaceae bacterium]|nr:PepSY domain-containing protein [Cyclobacteriaceae bacterium]
MRKIVICLFLSVSAFIYSCTNTEEPALTAPTNIQDKSTDMFAGQVIESKKEMEDGIEVWEVKVQNANGAIVRFYWRVDSGVLYEIDGQEVPFNYEVTPGNGLITYSAAKTQAIAALKNDDLLRWQLEKESDFANKWIYRFEFDDDGSTIRVFVDASTGDVLEID